MASRWAQRESKRPSTWRQSLLFNSILVILPFLAARIIAAAYTADIVSDPMSVEARAETRNQIEDAFRNLKGSDAQARGAWAARIDATLKARDFSAARGYLLAAPYMLDRQDSQAVLAAAQAEETGTEDQRLSRAALLFLPDETRASYERAIEPPKVSATDPDSLDRVTNMDVRMINELPSQAEPRDTVQDGPEPADDIPETDDADDTGVTAPFAARRDFFLLGDKEDLARRTQRWISGSPVNDFQLRLRALGRLAQENESGGDGDDYANAASILVAASRANRLKKRFSDYISSRVEDALPLDIMRVNLTRESLGVATMAERAETYLDAYRASIQPAAHERLTRDMLTIARLAELTSSSGAMTLLENASSPEDMRRILLVTEASGERAVALSEEIGPKILGLAQIGVKWTRDLILQVMALMALGMTLIWTTLSAFTHAETVRTRRR